MEEIPEMFMSYKIAKEIYKKDRSYNIFETTHSSDYNVDNKLFFPDKFIFVSQYNCFKFNKFGIPTEVVEYPIDKKNRNLSDKNNAIRKLGLDPDYHHILNVGLFTPRKNQAYAFEIARKLETEKIKIHFVGNQAGNFEHYWKPLMDNKPDNCIIWGERNDVDDFYTACDIFLFTSMGFRYDKELNPLVIKEALQEDIPLFLFPLDVYCGKYDDIPECTYMSGNPKHDADSIKKFLSDNNNNNIKKLNIETPDHWETCIRTKNNHKVNIIDISKHYIEYNDILPIKNCNRPDDIGRLGVHGINNKDYEDYLTYRKIIENEFHHDIDYLVIKKPNEKNDKILSFIDKMGDEKYMYFNNTLIINKNSKNIIFSKYKTDGWDNTRLWLEKTFKKDNGDIIKIKYNDKECKVIFNIESNTSDSTTYDKIETNYKLKFKHKNNELYSTECKISTEYNCWSKIDKLKKLNEIDIEFYDIDSNLLFIKHLEINSTIEQTKNKDLFVLSTYIDNSIKKTITIDCINSIKKMNKDIMLSSHIPINDDVIEMTDFYIYDKYNPMIKHSLYNNCWYETNECKINVNFDKLKNVNNLNQSLSVLNNIENSVRMAKSLGFKRIINITYDFIFSDDDLTTIQKLLNRLDETNKQGYFMKFKDNNLDVLKTVFFIIDVDLFVNVFDNIRTEINYNNDCKNLGIDNFLERYFYKKLENHQNNLLIENTTEINLFNGKINLFSGAEYLSILPIDNVDDEFVISFISNNVVDDRTLQIQINNIVENYSVTGSTRFFRNIKIDGDIELGVIITDNKTNNILSSEYFGIINKDNMKSILSGNGNFTYKNKIK